MSRPLDIQLKALEEADKAMQAKYRFSLDDVLDVFEICQELDIQEKNLTTYFIRDLKDGLAQMKRASAPMPVSHVKSTKEITETKATKENREAENIQLTIAQEMPSFETLTIRPIRAPSPERAKQSEDSRELQFYLEL